jgi:hypothetical protein
MRKIIFWLWNPRQLHREKLRCSDNDQLMPVQKRRRKILRPLGGVVELSSILQRRFSRIWLK